MYRQIRIPVATSRLDPTNSNKWIEIITEATIDREKIAAVVRGVNDDGTPEGAIVYVQGVDQKFGTPFSYEAVLELIQNPTTPTCDRCSGIGANWTEIRRALEYYRAVQKVNENFVEANSGVDQ